MLNHNILVHLITILPYFTITDLRFTGVDSSSQGTGDNDVYFEVLNGEVSSTRFFTRSSQSSFVCHVFCHGPAILWETNSYDFPQLKSKITE